MVANSNSPKTEEPRPRRVLVVEDDEGLNNLALKALRKAGYDTEGVSNAAAAIEHVLANPEVALLLDIKLPDMTGGEVISALSECNCPVPFIVMTGHGDERTAVEMMKRGAGDYLVKGLDLIERLPGAFRRLFRELDTERQLRAAEEELRESEEKYRDLIQQASDGIFICDPEGALLEVNPACRAILGYTDEDLAGSNIRDFLPIDSQGDDQLHLDELTTGKGVLREYDVIRKDGSKIEVEINAIRMSNNQIQGIVRDISERKHAEQALKNSEEKYRSLFEYAGDSIFLINLATHRFVDMNMNATKLLGYSKDELLQLSLEDIYSPEPAEKNQAIMQELQDSGSVVFEQTHLRKNGTKVPVEISTRMIRYGEKKVFQSFVRDITKRKHTEEALRESEERFRNLVETSQDMIANCDVKGRFTYLNPAWERLLGYKLTEMLGHTFSEFKPPEIAQRDLQTFKRTLKGGATFGYETIFISKSGQQKHLLFNSRVLKDSKGEIIGTQATAHDITDRKRAEEALLETNEKLKTSIDNMPNAYILCDTETLVLEWNRAAEKIFGYSKEEMLGKNIIDFVVPEKIRHLVREAVKKLKVGEAADYSEKDNNIRKDGKLISCQWFNTPLADKNGKVFGILFIAQDVTERKLLEREVLEVSEKEQRRIGQILHDDLGQYLLGTAYKSELLEQQLAEQSLDEAATAAQITELIHESINRSQDLAKELYPVDLETSNLAEALHRLGRRTEHLFDVSCHISCDPPVPGLDHVVATHLYRIAQEAVHNAIKHGRANRIVIYLKKTITNQIELRVRDNGIGLPNNWESRLGMGLHMMKYRASMCDGSFDIRTKQGGGTVVTCTSTTGINQLEMPEDHPPQRAKGNE